MSRHAAPGPDGHRVPRPQVPRGAVAAGDGVLLVDKPAGLTSHDVVALVRRMGATRKVGHAGTLDPMATGLLVLATGRATRLLTYLVGAGKTYEATVRLGQETGTEDADSEVVSAPGCPAPDSWEGGAPAFERRLAEVMTAHTGRIMQVPSAVSAIKVDGVRAYARVRDGETVELAARPVVVEEIVVRGGPRSATAQDGTAVVDLDLGVRCSSGTYVRALARDIGRALGTGAHLTALRRTRVGPFDVGESRTVTELARDVDRAACRLPAEGLDVIAVSEVARRCFAVLVLTSDEARRVRHGQTLSPEVLSRVQGEVPADRRPAGPEPVRAPGGARVVAAGFDPDGRVVALLTSRDGRVRPVLVLDPA
ncbi:tRNA pseudouridine(55) synthase TruB [Actinomyces howellii]|uniref:tRNA pseudouridine synthase B n=1 Tax=Actinomyces howellii TaxID=52771 RepID=A0A3S4SM28_9ACTO|nr:tRNA pseudouridine(55) synthase TruB [Actinomyces howellii]VEG26884.1 tRNA pseudouridine synthase B [Actinomyces howellii]